MYPMKRIAVVTATRPDVIKLAPVIHALKGRCSLMVGHTDQHTDLCDPLFQWFEVDQVAGIGYRDVDPKPPNHRTLNQLTSHVVREFGGADNRADLVIVLGDTTSAMAAALSAFNNKTPVLHIEAGLRTNDRNSPWPEEMNRRLIGQLASYHACSTPGALRNLAKEGVDPAHCAIIGQTAIDALKWTMLKARAQRLEVNNLVMVTMHRRENHDRTIQAIANSVIQLAQTHPDMRFLWPVHPNPAVKAALKEATTGQSIPKNLKFSQPLEYVTMVEQMAQCSLMITDSGGIQEEATYLNVPFIVARDTTERQEAIDVRAGVLGGRDGERIYELAASFLADKASWYDKDHKTDIYGDGNAATQLVPYMVEWNLL